MACSHDHLSTVEALDCLQMIQNTSMDKAQRCFATVVSGQADISFSTTYLAIVVLREGLVAEKRFVKNLTEDSSTWVADPAVLNARQFVDKAKTLYFCESSICT